jgi:hypothetical protein
MWSRSWLNCIKILPTRFDFQAKSPLRARGGRDVYEYGMKKRAALIRFFPVNTIHSALIAYGRVTIITMCLLVTFLGFLVLYTERRAFILTGPIDAEMERKAGRIINIPGPVFVDTGGGDASTAENIAKLMVSRGKSIFILNECSSACAEILIPAAKHVYATENSIIGFHRNDLMALSYFRTPEELNKYCEVERFNWLKSLYSERGLNPYFYKMTADKLGIVPVYGTYWGKGRNCENMITASAEDMWFPTSIQIKKYLGLDLGHPICADRKACWMPYLEKTGLAGDKYIIGDEFFKIKGSGNGLDGNQDRRYSQ